MCFSSQVGTGISIDVDQNPQSLIWYCCQLLPSCLKYQQKEDKSRLLTKVILAFQQCLQVPVACMHVFFLCSVVVVQHKWRRMDAVPYECLLLHNPKNYWVSSEAFPAQQSTLNWLNGKGMISALGQRTGFSEYLTNWSTESMRKRSLSGSLLSLSGSLEFYKDFRGWEWKWILKGESKRSRAM